MQHDELTNDNAPNTDRLAAQYNNLILKAEYTNRDNRGEVSLAESEYYDQAAQICDQIMHMNLRSRDVYAKWQSRKDACRCRISEIAGILAPQPAVPPKQPVKNVTASGFTTRNACDDIPAQTIDKWHKRKPDMSWDDLTGMTELKAALRRETAAILRPGTQALEPARSYFFYGAPGTGKTLSIRAFVRELMDAGYRFLALHGGDIHSSFVGVAEKTVRAAFQEAMDNEPCVLVIDDIESVCFDRGSVHTDGHRMRLTITFLEACQELLDSGKRVVLLTTSNIPREVDDAFVRHSRTVRFPLPEAADRTAFFARELAQLPLKEGFSFRDMADATEGYSYRELNRLSEDIAFKMKDALLTEYRVFGEDGCFDPEASDQAAVNALTGGRFPLTRAIFEAALAECPPADKSDILRSLKEYETFTWN